VNGLNIHATYLFPSILNVGIGTDLEFSSFQQPFTPHAKGKVISTKIYNSLSQIFTLNSSINVNINNYVVITDTPQVFINNLTIVNNRVRGILLETRNVYIKNSIFNKTSGPAILFQPSLSWHEGPYAINITLTPNLYLNNNEGISKNKGVITILPDPIQFILIIANVQIRSSTFLIGIFNQGLIQSYNENNTLFHGNYINKNHSSPFLAICNTRNITARN
jgi:hypothetical protein